MLNKIPNEELGGWGFRANLTCGRIPVGYPKKLPVDAIYAFGAHVRLSNPKGLPVDVPCASGELFYISCIVILQ